MLTTARRAITENSDVLHSSSLNIFLFSCYFNFTLFFFIKSCLGKYMDLLHLEFCKIFLKTAFLFPFV